MVRPFGRVVIVDSYESYVLFPVSLFFPTTSKVSSDVKLNHDSYLPHKKQTNKQTRSVRRQGKQIDVHSTFARHVQRNQTPTSKPSFELSIPVLARWTAAAGCACT